MSNGGFFQEVLIPSVRNICNGKFIKARQAAPHHKEVQCLINSIHSSSSLATSSACFRIISGTKSMVNGP